MWLSTLPRRNKGVWDVEGLRGETDTRAHTRGIETERNKRIVGRCPHRLQKTRVLRGAKRRSFTAVLRLTKAKLEQATAEIVVMI